jgi:dihydrofolate reductase
MDSMTIGHYNDLGRKLYDSIESIIRDTSVKEVIISKHSSDDYGGNNTFISIGLEKTINLNNLS